MSNTKNPDVIYGYGLNNKDLSNISDTMLLKFIQEHDTDIFNTIKASVNNGNTLNNALTDYAQTDTMFSVLAIIMSKELNIQFSCHCDHGEVILAFCESYPWCYSDTEKQLTKDKLNTIISDYIYQNFGIQLQPDFVTLEYYND